MSSFTTFEESTETQSASLDPIDAIVNIALDRINGEYLNSQITEEDEGGVAILDPSAGVPRDLSVYSRRVAREEDMSSDEEEEETTDTENHFSHDETETVPQYMELSDVPEEEEDFSEFVSASVGEAEAVDETVESSAVPSISEASAPRVGIPPLTQDKINFIKSAMSSFQLKPRFGAELLFESIQRSQLRVGDESQ